MVWRTKRRIEKKGAEKKDAEKKADDEASPAVVARVTGAKGSAAAAELAVRGALARAEIDREVDRIAIVPVGNAPFARVLGAALARDRNARVVALDDASPNDADAAVLVLAESVPEAEAEAARAKLAPILLGAVVAEETRPAPDTERAEALAEFAHREAALRRLTESVEQQRAEVEERERALEERERELEERERKLEERERALAAESAKADDTLEKRVHALEAEAAASAERLSAALERADGAEKRARDLDEELSALRGELEEARREPEPGPQPEPEREPAPQAGAHNLQELEERVVEAQVQNDPRAEEWAYYIPLLREHAALDGRLPREFDTLIESVFD